jgi:hypothetical protein
LGRWIYPICGVCGYSMLPYRFSFLFERGYLLVSLLAVVSGMRKGVVSAIMCCFARTRSDGGGTSAASGIGGWDQGSEARNSFLAVMFTTSRGLNMHLCGIRAEIRLQGDKRCYDTKYHDTTVALPNNLPRTAPFVTTSALRSMSLAIK